MTEKVPCNVFHAISQFARHIVRFFVTVGLFSREMF